MPNSRVKRRAFSLAEIIIACILLTTCAGACYFAFNKAYKERQHKEVLSRIVDTLKQAYTLSQLTNSEVAVIFSTIGAGKKWIQISSNTLHSNTKVKTLAGKPEILEGVVELTVANEREVDDRIKIRFFPWGLFKPETVIAVRFANSQVRHEIVLKKFLQQKVHETGSEALYPKDVLEDEKEKKSVRTP